MPQHYSNPKREADPHALPDLEVFYISLQEIEAGEWGCDYDGEDMEPGWYWWSCFPGCLPDGDACGPFETEAEALEDARDGVCDDEGPDDAGVVPYEGCACGDPTCGGC